MRKFRKLGRDTEHRWAMMRNMVTSLIKHERIMTTTAKAKELRPVVERVVTRARKGTQHDYRMAAKVVRERPAMVKLFEILGPRYEFRDGGYTRIMKLAVPRRGDSADMAYIEFVDREGELRRARPPSPKGSQLVAMMERMGKLSVKSNSSSEATSTENITTSSK